MVVAGLLEGPDEGQMEEIRKDLGEDPDRFANNLKLLEEWIECQPHLPKNYGKTLNNRRFVRGAIKTPNRIIYEIIKNELLLNNWFLKTFTFTFKKSTTKEPRK